MYFRDKIFFFYLFQLIYLLQYFIQSTIDQRSLSISYKFNRVFLVFVKACCKSRRAILLIALASLCPQQMHCTGPATYTQQTLFIRYCGTALRAVD